MTIDIALATTMDEILQAYPSAKVGLFQRYHIGGCMSCSYKPTDTLEDVCKNFDIKDSLEEMTHVICGSADVFTSLHVSAPDLAAALRAKENLHLLDVRTRAEYEIGHLADARLVTVELTFEILDSWPKDSRVVFTSNDGRRSLDKASYFRAYGLPNARTLTGGLAAWNAEVVHEAVPLPVVGEL